MRGGRSGPKHLEFQSGLLSSRLCAAFKPRGEKQTSKVFQPPTEHNKYQHKGQPHSVLAECSCRNKKKFPQKYVTVGVCEGWGEEDGDKGKVRGGAVRENVVAGDRVRWPTVAVSGGV